MPPPLLEQIIEEAALIWRRERDGLPCSIRRARLDLMLRDYTHDTLDFSPCFQPEEKKPPPRPHLPDFKKLAANDRDADQPLAVAC